jgi:hypothetical protein
MDYPTLTDKIEEPIWIVTDEFHYETTLDKTVKVLEVLWLLAVIYKVFRP